MAASHTWACLFIFHKVPAKMGCFPWTCALGVSCSEYLFVQQNDPLLELPSSFYLKPWVIASKGLITDGNWEVLIICCKSHIAQWMSWRWKQVCFILYSELAYTIKYCTEQSVTFKGQIMNKWNAKNSFGWDLLSPFFTLGGAKWNKLCVYVCFIFFKNQYLKVWMFFPCDAI